MGYLNECKKEKESIYNIWGLVAPPQQRMCGNGGCVNVQRKGRGNVISQFWRHHLCTDLCKKFDAKLGEASSVKAETLCIGCPRLEGGRK